MLTMVVPVKHSTMVGRGIEREERCSTEREGHAAESAELARAEESEPRDEYEGEAAHVKGSGYHHAAHA